MRSMTEDKPLQKNQRHCRATLKATLYENDISLARRLKEQREPFVAQVRITPVHNWAGIEAIRLKSETAPRSPCRMLWQKVQMLWDGQITLCCMDSMEGRFKMGNVREQNLSYYWLHDPGLLRARLQHEALDFSELPECANCDMWAYFDIDR